MPQCIARLRQEKFSIGNIDETAGVIYGVKVAQLGKVACFAGPDGKPRSTTIGKHVDALMAHAGNRSIPVHWTHERTTKDNLHDGVGFLNNFRKDDEGSLIADFHVAPTDKRSLIFWNAEKNRENMMLSPVYGYLKEDKDSMPVSFDACDLVSSGAAVTALFSDYSEEQNKPMETKEFIALFKDALKDPEIATLLKPQVDTAAMSASVAEQVKTAVTAQLTEMKPAILVEATAAMTAKLGDRDALINAGQRQTVEQSPEEFITAEMASMDVPNRAVAINVMAAKKPALYNKFASGK